MSSFTTGTLITENEAGIEQCKSIFGSTDKVDKAVQQLVKIASYHGLEGWLINIENQVPSKDLVSGFSQFANKLWFIFSPISFAGCYFSIKLGKLRCNEPCL